jgi:hypothetical protein
VPCSRSSIPGSKVRSPSLATILTADRAFRGSHASHLLELPLGGYLLDEERCLNSLEEPGQPPDELALGDPELRIGGRAVVEGDREPIELSGQLG